MSEFTSIVLNEIAQERTYQENKWGNETDDTVNTPNDYCTYLSAYATKWFPGGFLPYNPQTVDEFRTSMVKTAAIAVAAVESIDRQREALGHTFYEGVRDVQ